ncbi:MAG: molybdopterin dinucleotide-binding protein [Deltaproteobacteria bacterium]|nr:molybdopterin dinucleotide-binding protein [Deltaproteobacteria bacterium]
MKEWKKTTCAICGIRCNLEVNVENNRIVKVRPDKDSPVSEGYICRKGMNVAYHQHNADRLLYPLKREGNKFERISWDQAIAEISEKLKKLLQEHGPRSLASMVGGGEFNFYPWRFLIGFVDALGSHYHYSAGNQEFAGRYWAHGLTLGSQLLEVVPDYKHTEMMMVFGWNGMMSHQIPQARKVLTGISKDPNKLLIVIDPRRSETAKIADIHLALRPGTDALLLKSMIAIILREGLYNQEYIDKHASGFQEMLPWFAGFDVKAALKVCELEYDQVLLVCREFGKRQSCLRDDLGILMNRHSAFVSYLLVVLLAICGRIGVPGGNYLVGEKIYSDPNDPKTWRTAVTDIPAIAGTFPPNVMPEEIVSDRPDRIRSVFVLGANPLRSYADTTAYEDAFGRLDLLVVAEIAMSETAKLAHYVLPCRSTYESWSPADAIIPSTANKGFLEVINRMRRPVVEVEGEQKEPGEIFTLLADAMGLIPVLPDSLYQAAGSGSLGAYRDALTGYIMEHPETMKMAPFIVAKTLGNALGSAQLANYFAGLLQRSRMKQEEAVRVGFDVGPNQGLALYKATIDHPEGVLVGKQDIGKNLGRVATKDGRIRIHAAEVEAWIQGIKPDEEEKRLIMDAEFPLLLMAGRHMDMNANTGMRDPAWNKGRRPCTLAMHPADAEKYGFSDGQTVKVITEAGEETIEVEVTEDARKGQVIIPHGFGLVYDGVKYGANVNRLTKNTNRDFVGTPMHRYVPCRVEAA